MWNAGLYERYGKERSQPSVDLAARLRDKEFQRILDVGCGSGMSTLPLVLSWENAEIIGIDRSAEMLKKAEEMLPAVTFLQRDCREPIFDLGTFDLIFSNAFIQWLPNQEEFIKNAFAMLNEGGFFAAQIPLFGEMPANACITEAEKQFARCLEGIEKEKFVLHSAREYYDMLSASAGETEMWITDYFHEMDSPENILEFLRGTALLPYTRRLNEEEQAVFMQKVQKNLEAEYPRRANGKVLFPFKRLFLIGRK